MTYARTAALAAVTLVLLAGCGDPEESRAREAGTSATRPSATPTQTPTPTPTVPTYPPGRPLPDDVLAGFPLDVGMAAGEGWRVEGPGPTAGPLPNDVDVCGDWITWPPQDVETVERLRANLYAPDGRQREERDLFRHPGVHDAVAVLRDIREVLDGCRPRGGIRWEPRILDTGHDSATATLTARGTREGSVFQWTRVGDVTFMLRITRPQGRDTLDDLVQEVTASSQRIAAELEARR